MPCGCRPACLSSDHENQVAESSSEDPNDKENRQTPAQISCMWVATLRHCQLEGHPKLRPPGKATPLLRQPVDPPMVHDLLCKSTYLLIIQTDASNLG